MNAEQCLLATLGFILGMCICNLIHAFLDIDTDAISEKKEKKNERD